jgi:hypothetical protein
LSGIRSIGAGVEQVTSRVRHGESVGPTELTSSRQRPYLLRLA